MWRRWEETRHSQRKYGQQYESDADKPFLETRCICSFQSVNVNKISVFCSAIVKFCFLNLKAQGGEHSGGIDKKTLKLFDGKNITAFQSPNHPFLNSVIAQLSSEKASQRTRSRTGRGPTVHAGRCPPPQLLKCTWCGLLSQEHLPSHLSP